MSPVKLNAPGPQGAVPAGIERSSAVLNRISDSGKARGDVLYMYVTAQKAKVDPSALRSAYPDGPVRSVGVAGATRIGGVGVVGGCVGSVEGPVPITHLPPLLRLLYCFNLSNYSSYHNLPLSGI